MSTQTCPHEFTLRGQPASIVVIRNDGYCWGEVTLANGRTFEVGDDDDLYDEPDSVVVERLIAVAQDAPYEGDA